MDVLIDVQGPMVGLVRAKQTLHYADADRVG